MTTTATVAVVCGVAVEVADELTTVWRPVPGFDGYEVSNDGRVRSWRLPYRWGEDRSWTS